MLSKEYVLWEGCMGLASCYLVPDLTVLMKEKDCREKGPKRHKSDTSASDPVPPEPNSKCPHGLMGLNTWCPVGAVLGELGKILQVKLLWREGDHSGWGLDSIAGSFPVLSPFSAYGCSVASCLSLTAEPPSLQCTTYP